MIDKTVLFVVLVLNLYSYFMFGYSSNVQCRYSEMSYMNNVHEVYMTWVMKINAALCTSQIAESYSRFPATASHGSDWLPCQAEAVQAKTVTVGRCANAYSYHSM